MGLGDDILLAMAPLGILTCVVSAIRVGGKKWLKALVGRARESLSTAEMEILSSTSDTVCELWSGTEIGENSCDTRLRIAYLQPRNYSPRTRSAEDEGVRLPESQR